MYHVQRTACIVKNTVVSGVAWLLLLYLDDKSSATHLWYSNCWGVSQILTLTVLIHTGSNIMDCCSHIWFLSSRHVHVGYSLVHLLLPIVFTVLYPTPVSGLYTQFSLKVDKCAIST